MVGPAHIGWTHKRKTGDPADVARWEPVARKVLGYAIEQARRSGLQTYKVVRKADDGTLLIGELIGGIPRYSVECPPRPSEPEPPRLVEDFVVWPRNADHPDGLDPGNEHHQLILRRRTERRWQTYFYDSDIIGYEDFDRRKATYAAMFPDGIAHAGNVDWRSRRGEVISWYGPSSRYWPDAYVQPRAQLGKFVFMLGQPLLDVAAYRAASVGQAHGPDEYVAGAAIRRDDGGTWLVVVHTEATNEDSPPSVADIQAIEAHCRPYSLATGDGGIYRYRLTRYVDPAGVPRFQVVAGSRELLAALPGNRAEPWFFNESCTAGHAYLLPDNGWFMHIKGWESPNLDPGFPYSLPDGGQTFREAIFAEDGSVTLEDTTLTVTDMGPGVQVASDYKGDERVHATVANWCLYYYQYPVPGGTRGAYGSVRWDICGFQFRAGGGWSGTGAESDVRNDIPNVHGWYTASIVYADLREDVLILLTTMDPITGTGRDIEVYHRGKRVHHEPAADNGNHVLPQAGTMNGGNTDWQGLTWRTEGLPPYYFVYGICVYQTATQDTVNPIRYIVAHCGGSNAGMAWSPYPDADYFGMTPTMMLLWDDPLVSVGSLAPSGFQGGPVDANGHAWVAGCAARDGAIVASCWRPRSMSAADPKMWDGDGSFAYATGDYLADLTGVDGGDARYHPVWRLGIPPLKP